MWPFFLRGIFFFFFFGGALGLGLTCLGLGPALLTRSCAQKLDIDLKLDLINESNIAQVFRLFDKSN